MACENLKCSCSNCVNNECACDRTRECSCAPVSGSCCCNN